jgi:hypothetical protein
MVSFEYLHTISNRIVHVHIFPYHSSTHIFQTRFFSPHFAFLVGLDIVVLGTTLNLRYETTVEILHRVLRRIFGPERDEVTRDWRKLHNEELHNLYSSPNIIRMIKSRRMRWAGHVARMVEKRNVYSILVGKA